MSKLLEDIASVKPRSDTRREREMYFVLYTHRTVADVVVKPLVCMLLKLSSTRVLVVAWAGLCGSSVAACAPSVDACDAIVDVDYSRPVVRCCLVLLELTWIVEPGSLLRYHVNSKCDLCTCDPAALLSLQGNCHSA